MKSNLALIGFMGSGKTEVGDILAKRLGKDFIETDLLVEQIAGKTIPQVFHEDGEAAFRNLEVSVIREIANRKNAVIACGGGIILKWINIERLKKNCIIVYLAASPKVILERIRSDKNERPLLEVPNKVERIRELLEQRKLHYEQAADIKIDTSKLNTKIVAETIIGKIKNESFN